MYNNCKYKKPGQWPYASKFDTVVAPQASLVEALL